MRFKVVQGFSPAGRPDGSIGRPKGLHYVLSAVILASANTLFAQSPPARATAVIGGKTVTVQYLGALGSRTQDLRRRWTPVAGPDVSRVARRRERGDAFQD